MTSITTPSGRSRVAATVGWCWARGIFATYSSRTKLPNDMPPQLMPPIRLPARDSLRLRLTLSRFWLLLLTEMGLGPVLTKESCRERPMGPVVISMSGGSQSTKSASSRRRESRSAADKRESRAGEWTEKCREGLSCFSKRLSETEKRGARCREEDSGAGGVAGWEDGERVKDVERRETGESAA